MKRLFTIHSLFSYLWLIAISCKPLESVDVRQQLATGSPSTSLPAEFSLDIVRIVPSLVPFGDVNVLSLSFTISDSDTVVSPRDEKTPLPQANHYIEYEICPQLGQESSPCSLGTTFNQVAFAPAPAEFVTILARMVYQTQDPRQYYSKVWRTVDFEIHQQFASPEEKEEGEELLNLLRKQQSLSSQIANDSKAVLSKLEAFFTAFKQCNGTPDPDLEKRKKEIAAMTWQDLSEYFLTEELPILLDWKPAEPEKVPKPELKGPVETVEYGILSSLGVPEQNSQDTIAAFAAGMGAVISLGFALMDVWSIVTWKKYLREQRTVVIDEKPIKLQLDKPTGLWRTPNGQRYYVHDPISKQRLIDKTGTDVFFSQQQVQGMKLKYYKRALYLNWDGTQTNGGDDKQHVARQEPSIKGKDFKFGNIAVSAEGKSWKLQPMDRKIPYNPDQIAIYRHPDDPAYDSGWFAKKLRGKLRVGKVAWAVGKGAFSIFLMGVAIKKISDMNLAEADGACQVVDSLRGEIQALVTAILKARSGLEVVKKEILPYI
ncbi:MAG: hypothetical protein HYW48_04655 [Deltaproteobacteria bacterium]|nr:hypothetical protein [Deltaproteobacteria bacterium]